MNAGELCIREVVYAQPDEGIREAARRMRDHHVGDVVVVREDERGNRKPVAMLTDRDLVVGVLAEDPEDAETLTVGDVLTRDEVFTVGERESVFRVVERMSSHGVRRVPVVDDRGGLVGLITFDDVVELLADTLDDLARLTARGRDREREERPPHRRAEARL